MIYLTTQEFMEATGINLASELKTRTYNEETNAEITLKRWSNILYDEVEKNSIYSIPDDEKLSIKQIQTIKMAIINLGLYYLNNGDAIAVGQRTETNDKLEIVPSHIFSSLRRVGLIKVSFGNRRNYL